MKQRRFFVFQARGTASYLRHIVLTVGTARGNINLCITDRWHITGYPQETAKLTQQALRKNAYACLEKPLNMNELLLLLKQIKEHNTKGIRKKPE